MSSSSNQTDLETNPEWYIDPIIKNSNNKFDKREYRSKKIEKNAQKIKIQKFKFLKNNKSLNNPNQSTTKSKSNTNTDTKTMVKKPTQKIFLGKKLEKPKISEPSIHLDTEIN